jgi:ribosome-associated heat shock protein Hsp15
MDKVRIDKWLWAARFFKTRSLAKQAIEGGKVQCEGQRVKASKELTIGLRLSIQKGWDKIEVVIQELSDQRRGAPQAQLLYEETKESITQREHAQSQRKASGIMHILHENKPNKKQRRQIHRFKRRETESPE